MDLMTARTSIGWLGIVALLLASSESARSQRPELVPAFPRLAFAKPIFLTHSNDSTDRIFVVQQNGIIKVFPNDSAAGVATTFLNISQKLSSSSGEEGLLGLAFHPRYAQNGYFFVNYTAPNPRRTVVARYSVSQNNPDSADGASEFKILEVYQPYANHNAGMLMFGQDGYLYIGMGDGGSGGDPQNRAQNLDSLLGKMLRIDVDTVTAQRNYAIPPDNPLVGNLRGFREEIYAWGLRNPWRYSQDPVTGEIWIGDVGQGLWEEIDLLQRGGNYGWRIMEAMHCYNPSVGCDTTGLIMPVTEYGHGTDGCSVTGGYVYRGSRRPDLLGAYIYGDFCSGRIWTVYAQGGKVTAESLLVDTDYAISSFGVDQRNELYVCDLSGGTIQAFAPSTSVAVIDRSNESSFTPRLEQNFPNPFNPTTTIRYSLPTTGYVRCSVYNLLGEEVALVFEGTQSAGAHELVFQNAGLPSGVYFYRLMAPGVQETKRMIVAR
jgi:glucose/arabinose dehydrogenase